VFVKHLGDRGVQADARLIEFVLRRMERSFAAAGALAAALDRAALERKQRITRKLAAEVWGDVAGASQDDSPEDMG
jgi:chromosomal replication initiation ATPase DnaA